MTRMTSPHAADWWFQLSELQSSDLSGLSCRPFCRYHCLTSVVHYSDNGQPDGCVVGAHGKMELRVVIHSADDEAAAFFHQFLLTARPGTCRMLCHAEYNSLDSTITHEEEDDGDVGVSWLDCVSSGLRFGVCITVTVAAPFIVPTARIRIRSECFALSCYMLTYF